MIRSDRKLGVVVHAYNSRTWERKVGRRITVNPGTAWAKSSRQAWATVWIVSVRKGRREGGRKWKEEGREKKEKLQWMVECVPCIRASRWRSIDSDNAWINHVCLINGWIVIPALPLYPRLWRMLGWDNSTCTAPRDVWKSCLFRKANFISYRQWNKGQEVGYITFSIVGRDSACLSLCCGMWLFLNPSELFLLICFQ